MPKQIRDRLAEKVRQLVKRNKKGHLKYRDVVVRHIDDLLGCRYMQTKSFFHFIHPPQANHYISHILSSETQRAARKSLC